jgi:hypothetical protein
MTPHTPEHWIKYKTKYFLSGALAGIKVLDFPRSSGKRITTPCRSSRSLRSQKQAHHYTQQRRSQRMMDVLSQRKERKTQSSAKHLSLSTTVVFWPVLLKIHNAIDVIRSSSPQRAKNDLHLSDRWPILHSSHAQGSVKLARFDIKPLLLETTLKWRVYN